MSRKKQIEKKKIATESVEEYLEAMLRLRETGKDLSTTNIAGMLKISPASVSGMLKKLLKEGYIEHKPYKGAQLTKRGEIVANRILRKHRLIEKFLYSLGLSKRKVHTEACKLEHHVSDELEGLIKKRVEKPRKVKGLLSLIDIECGEEACILSVEGGNRVIRRLEDMGLTPGTKIKVTRTAPFNGPIEISVRNSCLVIGQGMAKKIFVSIGK